jgi:hypothetical protein
MERKVLGLIGATFVVAACGAPGTGSMLQSEFQEATVQEPDGRVSLYSGHLIADALARGDDVESPAFATAFLRVRVPRSLLEIVPAALERPIFISLERAYPGVEILLHQLEPTPTQSGPPTSATNTTFTPADPWLTGHAQLLHDLSGALVAGAHIVKYSGTLPLGTADTSWGMPSCTGQRGCPALRYDNPDPCLWPRPLPADWILTPLQGQPSTLDGLCQAR